MATINPVSKTSGEMSRHTSDKKILMSRSLPHVVSTSSRLDGDRRSRLRFSLSNVNSDCRCIELKFFNFHTSIRSDCEKPKERCLCTSEQLDFETQVTASDIQPVSFVQTSLSLLENKIEQSSILRMHELPKRCPNALRVLAATKCLECHDCEEKTVVLSGEPHDQGTQINPCLISCRRDVQTGPSLSAVGPFCRLDYMLRKTRPNKNNMYCDCRRPVEHDDLMECSLNREVNFDFQQQVSPLDVSFSDVSQTEQTNDIEQPGDDILYSSYDPKIFSNKIHFPLDDENPYSFEGRYNEPTRCFAMQVSQNDICPTKLIQTDPCLLPHECIKARKFKEDRYCACTLQNESLTLITSVSDVSQQVKATDIGDSNETQTCVSLSTLKPFWSHSRAHFSPRAQRRENKRGLSGRTGHFPLDIPVYCCTITEQGCLVDAISQVSQKDLSVNSEVQTFEHSHHASKSYIRKQKWESKSWG